ncbi:Heterokaryon incompatibility protein [Lasiodiplodia theobromae]|uniref:Heterokaryon incompatibility protein n=1 Tax=Lasiodiplodia theobromae TaxID=45133 RepID=UPI0015C31E99|nr:Heterokaryon incompatibility protein [Lasiodiplodia theobromae]KAF4539592.1 Heterokaryon incompatibility protein [Lasiodiplodia theobromae]
MDEVRPTDSMEGESQTTFDYKPLESPNAFRTFTLLPGSSSEPVQCTINNRAPDDVTPYEALSYVWGKETDRTNIVCDGKELNIPQNLSDFLLQLRSPTEARVLWADSICISQDDEKEKGLQIRLMRSIFQEATKVLVWIGTDSSGVATLAFDFAYEMFHTERPEDLEQTSEHWKAISVLFQQDWFSRKWCFQEIVLAKEAEFRWGEATISWEHLGCAASWIQGKGYEALSELPSPGVHHACLAYSLGKIGTVGKDTNSPENKITFPHLMMLTQSLEASKIYDRIFALLGIPTVDVDGDNGATFMDPDYAISNEDLFRDFAKRCIESSKNLDVLSAVYHGRHIMQKGTWVPQWDVSKPRSIIPAVLGAKQFSASSHLGEFRASIKDKQLIVHGEEVDKIVKTCGVIPDIPTLRSNPYLIQDIWNTIIALPPDAHSETWSLEHIRGSM